MAEATTRARHASRRQRLDLIRRYIEMDSFHGEPAYARINNHGFSIQR
jgi:hypothetical protein